MIRTIKLNLAGSPWCSVLSAVKQLYGRSVDLLGGCIRKVGDGCNTSFWHDIWLDDRSLKLRFSRVYALELAKDCNVADRVGLLDLIYCFRRRPRSGVEMQQYLGLKEAVALCGSFG
ncbi:hypothetical protein LXL04_026491 [Taraxacum kok-saghyz]